MLTVRESTAFKRDVKRIRRGSVDLSKLQPVVVKLAKMEKLETRHSEHFLTGNWKGYKECHIAPDWLLIYKIVGDELLLARTGSHSELFG